MYTYYVAVQLFYKAWWIRPVTVLEAALLGLYEALEIWPLEEGNTVSTDPLYIWHGCYCGSPLVCWEDFWGKQWRREMVSEHSFMKESILFYLPDFEFWSQKGIKYLTQLYQDIIFHSFIDLKQEFSLPQFALFH